MRPVSAEELLRQLDEAVELLAATSVQQEAWADRTGFPVDEIVLQYLDIVPGWFSRLEEDSLIDQNSEDALLLLKSDLESRTIEDLFRNWTADKDGPTWTHIRSLSTRTLEILRAGHNTDL